MSAAETGLEMPVTTDRLQEPTFKTVKRGFDPDQVREYQARVVEKVQALETKTGKLGSDLQQAREERDAALSLQTAAPPPIESASSQVRNLMIAFDEDVERLRGEAEADALRMRAEAEAESQRILSDARTEAQRLQGRTEVMRAAAELSLQDAREESEKVMAELAKRREVMLAELRASYQHVLDTVTRLVSTVEEEQADDDLPRVIQIDRLDETKDEASGVLTNSLPEAPA